MGAKSWAVTITPLVVYLIGFAYSFVSGEPLGDQQVTMLQGLLYMFLGSGAIGVTKKIAILNKK